MDKTRVMEHQAKQFIGQKVKITCKRHHQPFPGMNFSPYSFQATLEGVERNTLKIRKDSGMLYSINIKDEYMTVEEIKVA